MQSPEAFLAIPLAAIYSDHSFSSGESHLIQAHLRGRTPYRSLAPIDIAELVTGVLTSLREQGWQQIVSQAVEVLSPVQQETAFALAVQLVCCDRQVSPEEADFLNGLSQQLLVPQERSMQIQESVALLYRDCLA